MSLRDLCLEPMILLDVQPSRTYFVSLFEELGLTPNIAFSSPSIEMVRGMVGQGFGFSLLVTRPHSECTYDGKKVVMVDLAEPVSTSGLAAAWLKRAQLTKPARLFVDYCREQLASLPSAGTDPQLSDIPRGTFFLTKTNPMTVAKSLRC